MVPNGRRAQHTEYQTESCPSLSTWGFPVKCPCSTTMQDHCLAGRTLGTAIWCLLCSLDTWTRRSLNVPSKPNYSMIRDYLSKELDLQEEGIVLLLLVLRRITQKGTQQPKMKGKRLLLWTLLQHIPRHCSYMESWPILQFSRKEREGITDVSLIAGTASPGILSAHQSLCSTFAL